MNTRPLSLAILVCLSGPLGWAQTNTFPASGNVGIGTTTPYSTLQVVGGDISIDADHGIRKAGDNWLIGYFSTLPGIVIGSGTTSDQVIINAGGAERVRITALGNVGIGTTTPHTQLEVAQGNSVGGITVSGDARYVNPTISLLRTDDTAGTGVIQYIGNDGLVSWAVGVNQNVPGAMEFMKGGLGPSSTKIIFDKNGNMGIGTTTPIYPLSVNGTVEAKEVIVQSGWSDYVFDGSYRLAPLSAVERAIETEHRLPGMPTAKEIAAKGVSLGEMQAKLLAQIEQITLRQIEHEKREAAQEQEIAALRAKISRLTSEGSKETKVPEK